MAINTQKFLPQGKKGGTLTVLPKATLAPVKPSSSDITKVEGVEESPILVIKTKLIKIEDILKGTLAAEKKAADDKRKAEEQQEREEAENEVEGDPKTGVKFKLPLPGKIKSWWGNIKKFFFTVLFGWLFLKFMKWLPKLKGILKLLAGLAEFLIDFGGRILNGLVTFVHWGYKAFEWTRGAIENVFGEKGVETFDKITGILKTVLNFQLSLTLAMIAFSKEFSGGMEGWARNFMSIFKHGVGRSFKRLVIKMFGKKMGGTILTKLGIKTAATTTATTATTATATTATTATATGASTAGGVAGVGVVGTTAIVTGAGLLASGLGEGMFQLKKNAQKKEAASYEKFNDKGWWNPMKYFWGAVHLMDKFGSYLLGTVGVILDIVGTPFRYLIELIRYPFLSKEGKEKQRTNLAKFDARIREQFREMINAFSLGFLAKEKGSFGSMFGKKGTDAMGYTKDGETKKGSKHVTKTDLGGMPGLSGSGVNFDGKGGSTYEGNSNNIRSTDSSSKKIGDIVSNGYSDDGEEIYVINNKSSSKLLNNSNKEEKVIALGGGGGSSSDAFASNYRQG